MIIFKMLNLIRDYKAIKLMKREKEIIVGVEGVNWDLIIYK